MSADRDTVPELLETLRTTARADLRAAVALELSDRGVRELFAVLVDLLRDERTAASRGTLLYALAPYDCSAILPLLVDLFVTGGFEVRREAFNRLRETDAELSDAQWQELVDRLQAMQRYRDIGRARSTATAWVARRQSLRPPVTR